MADDTVIDQLVQYRHGQVQQFVLELLDLLVDILQQERLIALGSAQLLALCL